MLALAAESGEHPLRHMLTAASGRDLSSAGDMAAVIYWRLPALTPTDPGPLPCSRPFHQRCKPIPSGGSTWQSDPNQSPTSPTRSRTTPAKVPPSQSGHRRADTRAPPSSANRSVAGRPRDQSPRPTSNRWNPTRNAPGPLETTPRPGIARATYARADKRQAAHTAFRPRHDDTQRPYPNPNGVPAGRPRLADSTPVVRSPALGTWGCTPRGRGRTGSTLPNLALSHGLRIASPRQTSTGVTLMSRAKRTRGAPHSKCPPQRSQAKPSLSASRRGSQGALCRARLRAVT